LLSSLIPSLHADAPVEAEVNKIVKQKQTFERLVITKEEGLELFADNPFKVSILQTKVPDGGRTTVYRCGDLIDLCRGPHVPHTGKIKAFAATRHSATNWLGDTDNDSLQRMYGISFPDKKQLKVWKENQEKVRFSSTVLVWFALLVRGSWTARETRKSYEDSYESHSREYISLYKHDRIISIPLILLSSNYRGTVSFFGG